MKNESYLFDTNVVPYNEIEALDLRRKGESILNPTCCLGILCTTKKGRYNKSCNLFQQSGEKYKNCQQWRKAADCYEVCGDIKEQLQEDSTQFYKESVSCYQKANSEVNAKKIFFKMIDHLEKKGQYYEAGKNCEDMGMKYENENNYNEAIYCYQEAIKLYDKDTQHEDIKNNLQTKLSELQLKYGNQK